MRPNTFKIIKIFSNLGLTITFVNSQSKVYYLKTNFRLILTSDQQNNWTNQVNRQQHNFIENILDLFLYYLSRYRSLAIYPNTIPQFIGCTMDAPIGPNQSQSPPTNPYLLLEQVHIKFKFKNLISTEKKNPTSFEKGEIIVPI